MHLHSLSTSGILKLFLTAAEKKFLCLGIRNCIILWYLDFLTRWENLHSEIEKWMVFPESRFFNSNPGNRIQTHSYLVCKQTLNHLAKLAV